jgi:hypothetical protein
MNAQEFLSRLDRLPDLLAHARQQAKINYYPIQKELREQCRKDGKPFLYSMPMRHLYVCSICKQQYTDVLRELEDPRRQAKHPFDEEMLHQVRVHGVPPDDETAAFLLSCSEESR